MKSPWKSAQELEPGREYLALVSDIPPKRLSATRRLFTGAGQVREQLGSSEGVVGFSLLARPLRKQYATLSVWTSDEALAEFARTGPHGRLMRELAPDMAPTTFVRWTFRGDEGRPTWREGLRRLREAAPAS